jgi:thiamine-phosphate pyrophosphorylase
MDWSRRNLCLLFTPELCLGDPWWTLDTALAAGVPLVQWRVKSSDPDGLRRCMAACAACDVPVIVNDHIDLAVESRAAGVHVGQDDTPVATARGRLADGQILGVSTHDIEQARQAHAAGADYIGLGPCHPTETKGYDAGLARAALADVLASATIPVFAIGGITADNLPPLADLGFRHFAVSSAILAADMPDAAVERMLAAIGG